MGQKPGETLEAAWERADELNNSDPFPSSPGHSRGGEWLRLQGVEREKRDECNSATEDSIKRMRKVMREIISKIIRDEPDVDSISSYICEDIIMFMSLSKSSTFDEGEIRDGQGNLLSGEKLEEARQFMKKMKKMVTIIFTLPLQHFLY